MVTTKYARSNTINSQEIRNPKSVEQVTSADLLLSVVLAQVDELEHVGVPRLDVDGERARTLVAALVDVTGGSIVRPEHGDDTVGVAVGTGDV